MKQTFDIQSVTQEEWQRELRRRILVHGEENEKLYAHVVKLFTAPGGILEDSIKSLKLPPKIVVHPGDRLPGGVDELSEDGRIHIAVGGPEDAAMKRLMAAYERWVEEELERGDNLPDDEPQRTAEGLHMRVTLQDRLPQERDKLARQRNRNSNRSRGEFDPTELLKRSSDRTNTWGQLLDWREIKREEPQLWQFYLERMFSDEITQKFSGKRDVVRIMRVQGKDRKVERYEGQVFKDWPLWKDWLRGLRVMNGIGTVDMSQYLGNRHVNIIENNPAYEIPLTDAVHILEKNLFSLPEIQGENGKKTVDTVYAQKLMGVLGYKSNMDDWQRRQFLVAVKAVAVAYLAGEMPLKDMPSLNKMLLVAANNNLYARTCKGTKITTIPPKPYGLLNDPNLKPFFRLDGEDYTRYFAVLPYCNDKAQINLTSPLLSTEQAFEVAKNTAQHLGEFLKIYSKSTGQSTIAIGKRLHVTHQRIQQIHAKEPHSHRLIERILSDENPYGLPVDEAGEIRADVQAYMRKHHLPILFSAPEDYAQMLERIRQIKMEVAQGEWMDYAKVKEMAQGSTIPDKQFEKKWADEIEQQASQLPPFKKSEIHIGNIVLHSVIGRKRELYIHKSDMEKLCDALTGRARG